MRDEKEERKKQGQTNKQGKATQHTQGSHFSMYICGNKIISHNEHVLQAHVHVHVHVYLDIIVNLADQSMLYAYCLTLHCMLQKMHKRNYINLHSR